MSVMIVSDYTVSAVASGMVRMGWIKAEEAHEAAEVLRVVNEMAFAGRYADADSEHYPVSGEAMRDFTDAEVWVSCRCWLYQSEGFYYEIDGTTSPELKEHTGTMMEAVHMVADDIERRHTADGTWKRRSCQGIETVLATNEHGCMQDIYDFVEWDLAA